MAQHITLDILKKLIAFDTTSCLSNLELMAYIQGYLQSHAISSELIYDLQGTKANLYATIGPVEKPGVMLSGHTDIVPVTGQNWDTDPYQLTEREGLLYGRGSCDMKGFIASVLAGVPQMINTKLRAPVHLAFSYDEEIGCIGVRRMIDILAQNPIKPSICIIGEPTSMQVVTAHKGKIAARVNVHGKECHSGMAPLGVNAINYAAKLIIWLEQLALRKQTSGPFDHSYDIPYSTVHVGTVKGGTALNIVPKHTSFDFEIRNIGAESSGPLIEQFRAYAQQLTRQMQLIDNHCKIDIDIITQYPGLTTTEDSQAIEFVKKIAGNSDIASINFGTEGGLFSEQLGVATLVCGPGSMEQGHKPNEFVSLAQLDKCDLMIQRLIEHLSEKPLQGH